MHYGIFERLRFIWYECLDCYMYICYWHSVNHRLWFEVFRKEQFDFNKMIRFEDTPIAFDYINKHNGGLLAKIDYIAGYVRNFSIVVCSIILLIVMLVYKFGS